MEPEPTSSPPPPAEPTRRPLRWWLGFLGLGLVFLSVFMQGVAMSAGIHCPHCEKPPNMALWEAYFDVKLGIHGLGALAGLAGIVVGPGIGARIVGVAALVVAFNVLMLTPR